MATFVRTQEIEHEIGAAGSVTIGVSHADLRIRGVDGEIAVIRATFEISASTEAEADEAFKAIQLRVERDARSLSVEEPDRPDGGGLRGVLALAGLLGGWPRAAISLDAEVPPGCALRASTVSGDLSATGLFGQQRYNTVSGDLLCNEAGGEITTNTVSGDVTVRADGELSLRTNAVSGDLSAVAASFRGLRANSVSGDLELEGSFAAAGNHRVDSVSGDLHIGLVGGATIEVRGLSSDVASTLPHQLKGRLDRRWVVIGDGASQITFSSMSGDLRVAAPRRRAMPTGARMGTTDTPARRADDLEVLQALERGEIDVDEASRRLAGSGRGTDD